MDNVEQLVDEAVLAFRHRLVEIGEQTGDRRAPDVFVAAERELVQMARERPRSCRGWGGRAKLRIREHQ